MPHHLQGVPDDPGTVGPERVPRLDGPGDDEVEPLVRPAWWRWLAVIVVLALVVATPFAYALYRLLD